MTVSVLMVVEGSVPQISRCVNVEEDMRLGDLAQIIDAALGFSGAATHLYVGKMGEPREVFAEVPSLHERDEDELTVGEMQPMTYVYDPSANWNIHVELLGVSNLQGPTPMLVDAAGPDVVEACSGPAMMTTFREQARLLAAGVEPDMEIVPLMFSFLPVMAPERVLDRLTVADPVSVATRIGYVAEELFFDQAAAAAEENPGGTGLADHFDAFLRSRPELREVLDLDPHPERNPAVISAVTEFFDQIIGGEDGPGELGGPADVVSLADYLAERAEAEEDPDLHPDSLREIFVACADFFSSPVPVDEEDFPVPDAVDQLEFVLGMPHGDQMVDFLRAAGFVELRGEYLVVSPKLQTIHHPRTEIIGFASELRAGFEAAIGREVWQPAVEYYVGGAKTLPDDEAIDWMQHLFILGNGEKRLNLTKDGRNVLKAMLKEYRG